MFYSLRLSQLAHGQINFLKRFHVKNKYLQHLMLKPPTRSLQTSVCRYEIPKLKIEKTVVDASSKDVLLYVSKGNERYFRIVNFFGFTQFVFWAIMSYSFFEMKQVSSSIEVKHDKEVPWYKKFDIAAYKNYAGVISSIIGWGVLICCFLHTSRSVRHIVLRKGGTSATIACHTPFGATRYSTLPLDNLSAQSGRKVSANSYIPIKVKGRFLHYLVDSNGNFVQPALYDRTVGVYRNF